MVLEFPAPHIAVLKPNPTIARARKLSIVAVVIAAMVAVCLAAMATSRPGHKSVLETKIGVMTLVFFGATGVSLQMFRFMAGSTRGITFDRRQGMVWKEGRKLEPIWQGGLRLRDVASLELTTVGTLGLALEMVMSRPQGERARLIVDGNRDAMKANATELARFLNIPLNDHTA